MSQLRGEQSRCGEEMLKLCWKEEDSGWGNWMDGSGLECGMESFCYLPRLAILCIGARRYGGAGYGKNVGIDTLIKSGY